MVWIPCGRLRLEGKAMREFGTIANAYLVVEDGLIAGFGSMTGLQDADMVGANAKLMPMAVLACRRGAILTHI